MLIGLLSDTHIAFPSRKLPPKVLGAFEGVDLILHMGDVWIPAVLDQLETVAPVLAARGDDDFDQDFGDDKRIKMMQILKYEGVTIWAVHVLPRYEQIVPDDPNDSYAARLYTQPDGEPPETPGVVLFGHTHYSSMEEYKGVLLVNPGSATMPNYVPKLGSVGLLTLKDGKAEAEIINLG